MDIIKINVPLFIRLLEMSREDFKDDADIHILTEIVCWLAKNNDYITMGNYPTIVEYLGKYKVKT